MPRKKIKNFHEQGHRGYSTKITETFAPDIQGQLFAKI